MMNRKYIFNFFIYILIATAPCHSQTALAKFDSVYGPPLFKKFDFMNSGIVGLSRYTRDLDKMQEMWAKTIRLDLFWGNTGNGWTKEMVSGTYDSLVYYYKEIDYLSQLLKNRNMQGYWSYCYIPLPLQLNNSYVQYNSNLQNKWGDVLFNFAKHFRENKLRPEYQGIWNEPDLGNEFFVGSQNDLCKLYGAGVSGLRKGDPDATVGGPDFVGAVQDYPNLFLDYVKTNKYPLDFFSFHYIGGSGIEGNINGTLVYMRPMLTKRAPYYDQTELIIGELNPTTNTADGMDGAIAALNTMFIAVPQPDLTRYFWAQAMNVGSGDKIGVIDYFGHRRAAYYAFKFYNKMPVDRKYLTITGGGLKGFASSDAHRSCVLIWNTGSVNKTIDLSLSQIPFTKGTMYIHRIDSSHNNYSLVPSSEETPPEVIENVETAGLKWKGDIPKYSVVYIEVNDKSGIAEDIPISFPASIIRQHYFFPDRTKRNYANFDRHTWIARLGSDANDSILSTTAVLLEDLPDTVTINCETTGNVRTVNKNSLLGFRLDFRVNDTLYGKSMLFHNGIYSAERTAVVLWGTKKPADSVVQTNMKEVALILKKYAPAAWSGKVLITFFLQNTGAYTTAKFSIHPYHTQYPFKFLTIPGTIESEDFNCGGNEIAYHPAEKDSTYTSVYRAPEAIAVIPCIDTSKGFAVRIDSGTWINYSVNVTKKDSFILNVRISAPSRAGSIHVVVGSQFNSKILLFNPVGENKWFTLSDTMLLDSGSYILRLVADKGKDIIIDKLIFKTIERPYKGVLQIPGVIQAEDFDVNGYLDSDMGNMGGVYRPSEDVDITNDKGIIAVGWTQPGEWMNYTVHVLKSTAYTLTTFVSANSSKKSFRLEMDGVKLMDTIVPNKYSFTNFTGVLKKNVFLTEGIHTLKFMSVTGNFNVDRMEFDTTTTGIEERTSPSINIFPVPAKDKLQISNNKFPIEKMEIFDLQGRLLLTLICRQSSPVIDIDISALQPGIYFIRITSNHFVFNHKFFKN